MAFVARLKKRYLLSFCSSFRDLQDIYLSRKLLKRDCKSDASLVQKVPDQNKADLKEGHSKSKKSKLATSQRHELYSAKNWRNVESILLRDVEKWTVQDVRFAWKRCVHAHLDNNSHQLRNQSPSLKHRGRQFLADLVKTTLFKLRRSEFRMTGKEARDIGWAAGKQWFMDLQLVDPVEKGVLEGVKKSEIQLVEAVPVAWAIANSGQYPFRLFEEISSKPEYAESHFNLQHCSNLLWSMAVCGYHPGDTFLQVLAEVASSFLVKKPESIIPQAVADVLWGLGRLSLLQGNEKLIHRATEWSYKDLAKFSPEEMLTMGMGLAMMGSLGLEDMRRIASAFHNHASQNPLDVYVDQFVALTLLFPLENRNELHETAFGTEPCATILAAHHDRQAQIAVQMKNNKFLQLISRQLDKVAEGKYEIGVLTEDRNLALEILVHGEKEDYSVIPVYPMSRSRNKPEIELGEVRIAQQLVEAQGIKFGGFLEWIRPEEAPSPSSPSEEDSDGH